MLSIVVIGRNEAETLGECFSSIHRFSDYNNLQAYEIIYVDSNSEDNSLQIAQDANVHKIYRLKEYYNTPIGMNIGIRNASYDTVLILAGDMQLNNFKFASITEKLTKKNFITGNLVEHILKNKKIINSYIRNYPRGLCGGVCFMRKKSFLEIGGMDEKMTKGQDYDFFIRAAKKEYTLIKIDKTICEHYTESYKSKNRLKYISTTHPKYRAYLLRKNVFSSTAWRLISVEFFPIFGALTALIFSISFNISIYVPIIFFILGCIYKTRANLRVEVFVYQIIKNIIFVFSLFMFFPESKEFEVEIIKRVTS